MTMASAPNTQKPDKRPGYWLLAGSGLTYLLIVLGGLLCATASGQGCPDWPGCFGGLVPPPQMAAILEYAHRVTAALTLVVMTVSAALSWRSGSWLGRAGRLPAAALVLLLAVAAFGALAVLRGLPPLLAMVDVGSALLVLALMLATSVLALARQARRAWPGRLVYRGGVAWSAIVAAAAVYFVLVTGMLAAGPHSLTQCVGGPLFATPLAQGAGWLQNLRRLAAGVAGLAVLATAVQAWRTRPRQSAIVCAATVAAGLFAVEVLVGGLMVVAGFMIWLLVVSVGVTAALWAAVVVSAILAGLPPHLAEGA